MPVDFDDDPHGSYGEELGHALRRTADGFRTDTRGLVAAGHERGRRLRRRRTAMVSAAVAAVAAAGLGGAVAATGGTSSGGRGGGVASAPERPAATHPRPAPKALTAQQVEDLFVSLLPKGGTVSEVEGRGTTGELPPYAQVVYDDGHGKAAVAVDVAAQGDAPDCPSPNPDPATTCTVVPFRGGTLWVYKGFEYPDHRVETKEWTARFRTASGAVVDLSEWNSPQEKGAAITRPEPPLTASQISAIVTSPRWQEVIRALPAPGRSHPVGKGAKSGEPPAPEGSKEAIVPGGTTSGR